MVAFFLYTLYIHLFSSESTSFLLLTVAGQQSGAWDFITPILGGACIFSKVKNWFAPARWYNTFCIVPYAKNKQFLGFTMQICSIRKSVLMFMLYWREQMIGNSTCLLRNTRLTHTVNIYKTYNSLPWRCLNLELTPTKIYDVTWNPRWLSI